ncbi:penicillin-binding protein 2 [Novosphingobium sp. TH158]|uniref:penicillin-binding protein 2 n=1 Tax=Novosphingobium sp. TH158 TaxID=2067455 RepID=UPI000C7984E6|nr:penicillin-binding protein 2 [Novosphingobium sp. TH158]PLK25942.1 penicillin-binding protein 2 [Novosphingobium sp. TH158]
MLKWIRERFTQTTRRHVTSGQLANSFDRRAMVVGAMQGGLGVLLAARMTWIAVAENEHFKTLAESNRVNLSLIPPRRGLILDRNNQPLAANQQYYRVDLIPERVADIDETLGKLGQILRLTPSEMQDLKDKVEHSQGFQPVEISARLDHEQYDAISIRLPEMPGVLPQRGFARLYPTGPSVGHLVGYVGAASAEEYKKDRNPLLITPGYKLGKDGLEKRFEELLRGTPGARRTEVTASGRVVRDLEMREDVPGKPLKLTIDAGLQDYASRRIGPESAAVVVMDCYTGDLLCMASMPSFDPNSFSDGIGRIEWKMLSDDDHVPLRNKVLRGLFPPGSTVKPMVAMAFLEAGLDPAASVGCSGGLRVGNRVFHCWNRRGHGSVDMAKGIYQSCDVYFYHFAQKIGMEKIAAMARRLGLGQSFDLPVVGQSYGTVPDPAWKERKYNKPWAVFDTVNATIGQGYMLVNPLQQAVMAARIASGLEVQPRLIHDPNPPQFKSLGFSQEHLDFVHKAMSDVVNGPGTAGKARLPVENVLLAGKTGTAQVVGLNISSGKGGLWKHRDHGHFICFAPFDKPRYACAVVVQHGGGSGAAYPIARDVMTYLFDPAKAWEVLHGMEAGWGGTPQQRMAARFRAYESQYGTGAPKVGTDADVQQTAERVDAAGTPSQGIVNDATAPRPEVDLPQPASSPSPASSPAPGGGNPQ